MASRRHLLAATWNKRPWLVVESLVLATVLLALYLTLAERVGMHIDENHWIVTSNAWEPFTAGDRSSPIFAESYLTLTAPPATRYMVGIGRSLGGYGSNELITLWTFGASAEQNAAAGAMPSDDLLWWSRLPMTLLATLASLASFLLMRSLFGPAAAYLGLMLIVASPWLGANLVRAMAEAPLLCSLLLVAVATTWLAVAANHGSGLSVQMVWLVVAALGVGLAGSFKLSGLSSLAGVIAVWLVIVALGQRHRQLRERAAIAVFGVALVVMVTAATLVALNPYLDPDPLRRLIKLIQFRSDEMRSQTLIKTLWPVKGFGDRMQFLFSYMFEQAVLLHHPAAGAASLAFWLVGFGSIVRRVHDAFRQRMLDPAGAALVVALTAAGPMLATPLKWDRYLFLPVWFSALLVALGFTVCVRWGVAAVVRHTGWRGDARLDETPGWQQTRPES